MKVFINDHSFANDLIHLGIIFDDDLLQRRHYIQKWRNAYAFWVATLRHSIYKIVRPFVVANVHASVLAMYLVTSAGFFGA